MKSVDEVPDVGGGSDAATVSFLHIGKTGGSAVKAMLNRYNRQVGEQRFVMHSHRATLRRIWAKNPQRPVVFFVREPVARFVSGFNSALRFGRPRYNEMWSPAEAAAFSMFRDPNTLAEALGGEDEWALSAAHYAMSTIRHLNKPLTGYLHSVAYLEENRDKIAFVGRLEAMDESIRGLRARLELPKSVRLPSSERRAHRAPPSMRTELSASAVDNLRRWYADDLEVYDYCSRLNANMVKNGVREG
jgi:hypothetical protein